MVIVLKRAEVDLDRQSPGYAGGCSFFENADKVKREEILSDFGPGNR
jgi:hypothetical protein